jgi:cytochrome c-type biogenesis protein CcmH
VIRLATVLVAALIAAPAAYASEQRPTLPELEGEVMCPVCGTMLDQSNAPAAQQIKRVIVERIQAGDTKSEIQDRLVAEYGQAILAAPPREGLGWLAWLLPIVGIVGAAAIVGAGAWRWSRTRERETEARIDPALEARLDDELARWDS